MRWILALTAVVFASNTNSPAADQVRVTSDGSFKQHVQWSPDGKTLAAGGVDKSIRTWKADAEGGTLTRAAFAHQAAVTRLLYTADSKTLFSVGDDKVIKAWDVAKLTEKATLPAQPETVLSAALRPDGKQLAVGRFDGVLELVDPATGKAAFAPLPAKEKPKPRFPTVAEAVASDSARTAAKVSSLLTRSNEVLADETSRPSTSAASVAMTPSPSFTMSFDSSLR
jgi:WD40 repeat protein